MIWSRHERSFGNGPVIHAEPHWHWPSPLDRRARQLHGTFFSRLAWRECQQIRTFAEQWRVDLTSHIDREKEDARLCISLARRLGIAAGGRCEYWPSRHVFGLRRAAQNLAIAKLLQQTGLRLLYLRARDPVVEEVCTLLLTDVESQLNLYSHIPQIFSARALGAAGELHFATSFAIASELAWRRYRATLECVGSSRMEFQRTARPARNRFLERIGEHFRGRAAGFRRLPNPRERDRLATMADDR